MCILFIFVDIFFRCNNHDCIARAMIVHDVRVTLQRRELVGRRGDHVGTIKSVIFK